MPDGCSRPSRHGWGLTRPGPVHDWGAAVFMGLALSYGVAAHLTNQSYPEDDGFITYRYVENLLAGRGLVYNVGQHVFGASNPLYLFWLALLKSVAGKVPIPDLAVRMNFIPYVVAGLGMLFLLRSLIRSPWLAALLAGLFVMRGTLLVESVGGMESLMFVACVTWGMWGLTRKRHVFSAVIAGLSVLVRPEGVLLVLVVFLVWMKAGRPHSWSVLLALLAPSLGWGLFGFLYYGTPIYQSLIAKSRPLYPLPAGDALQRISSRFDMWAGELVPRFEPTAERLLQPVRTVVILALPTISLLGFAARWRLARPWRLASPVLAFFVLLVGFYGISNPLILDWYYPVIEALWFVLASVGVIWFASRLRRRLPRLAIVSALLVGIASPSIVRPLLKGRSPTDLGLHINATRLRVTSYRAAAEWLNASVPADWRVAAPEIGALGYYYRGTILDACGLVSPEAVPYQPVPPRERVAPYWGTIPREFVEDLTPEVVVTMRIFAEKSLYEWEWFRKNYALAKQTPLPCPLWGSETIDIFCRRDLLDRLARSDTDAAGPPCHRQ